MKKLSINCQAELVIDNQCIKRFVQDEYDQFLNTCSKFEDALDSDTAYSAVVSAARQIVHIPNDGSPAVVLTAAKKKPSVIVPTSAELKAIAEALAHVQVAAYNKGVYLNIGYEYNHYNTGFRFGLPGDCFEVKLSEQGMKMAEMLKLENYPRLTTDVDFS